MIKIDDTEYYDIKETMEILKLKRRTIISYIKSKRLTAFHPSPRKLYFTKEQLQNFIQGKNNGN